MVGFSDKVKVVRKKLNLSQEKLAAKLGVSFSTVNRWEKGHSYPSYKAQSQFESLCKENGIVFSNEE
jgi:transcriptional regulator with XRE-family HTH domain